MSGMQDLCACIFQQLQRTMQQSEGILQSLTGSDTVTQGGEGLPGLAPPTQGISPAAMLSMLFVFLSIMMLMGNRRPADRGVEKPSPEGQNREPPTGGGGVH